MAKNTVLRHSEKLGVTMCRWLKKKRIEKNMKCFRFMINKCRLKFGHDYEASYFPYLMG